MAFLVAFQGLLGIVKLATNLTLKGRVSFVLYSYMVFQILCFLVLFVTMRALQILWFMVGFPMPFQCSKITEMASVLAVWMITNRGFTNTMGLIQMYFPVDIIFTTPCTSSFCTETPVLLQVYKFEVVL